ncbi:MAG TPA: hypothetical protein PKD53_07280 [Chloroflexaceae bacterium]|nr:hypothetical protein [Chloroflexaceae bacterium]
MNTSRAERYEGLQELDVAGLHAFCSPGTITPALRVAGRCAAAQRVLARLFGFPIVPELLILGRADWPGRAAFPTYGVTHYDLPRRAIVAPGEPADFWMTVLELLERAAPEQLPLLRGVYGDSAGRPDLTAHVDTWVAHDLGHAYHLDRGSWFPRRWLMELFADLCAYTALAQAEPGALPALLTLPRALCAVVPEALPLSSLAEFETHYGDEVLDVATYLWYHGRLFRLAEQLHKALGERALQQLWAVFVVTSVSDVDDAELVALLAQVSPLLADAARTWPALPREGL